MAALVQSELDSSRVYGAVHEKVSRLTEAGGGVIHSFPKYSWQALSVVYHNASKYNMFTRYIIYSFRACLVACM